MVPFTLGLQYFWIHASPAYFPSNLIVEGKRLGPPPRRSRLLFTAFIAAVLVAGIAMAVDPLDATRLSEWVWTRNSHTGDYGMPYMIHLGDPIVMTPAFFLFGLLAHGLDARPVGPITPAIGTIPLAFSLPSFVRYSVPAPPGVSLVACFTMLFPTIRATDRLRASFSGP